MSMSNKSFLITGSSGFIGKLYVFLTEKGHKVLVLM